VTRNPDDLYAGVYASTGKPLTHEAGIALSPRGHLMFPTTLTKNDLEKGWAYFIQHINGGPIKIGSSVDPYDRLHGLNINSHDKGYVLIGMERGYKAQETNLHIRFRHLRLHGEWFEPNYEILHYIEWLPRA
jgi:hypothetical protein